jgi:hypothetical protein
MLPMQNNLAQRVGFGAPATLGSQPGQPGVTGQPAIPVGMPARPMGGFGGATMPGATMPAQGTVARPVMQMPGQAQPPQQLQPGQAQPQMQAQQLPQNNLRARLGMQAM